VICPKSISPKVFRQKSDTPELNQSHLSRPIWPVNCQQFFFFCLKGIQTLTKPKYCLKCFDLLSIFTWGQWKKHPTIIAFKLKVMGITILSNITIGTNTTFVYPSVIIKNFWFVILSSQLFFVTTIIQLWQDAVG
jgi:hypothetical protein